ncbi:BtpA/SgcQ family protein [Planotetraspora sp. A-T 1434]|uniref:BtpA/SgcQ family protein n=1 Tax=Planotetraspora sp. A-T 1434 TaxID=2979219 RepID=UPI0021C1EDB4|nr:BtpA/SgcQ family protein [Planotetraspora sp. A-T 1434]MCT9933010.1 BtpA/SgcQ family protein [Planotetraspora sp. A-T 1434]
MVGLAGRGDLKMLFGRRFALMGMIHLLPLPGAPGYRAEAGMEAAIRQAIREARILVDAGFDGLIVENGGDIPFLKPEEIGPETPAAMAVAVAEVGRAVSVPLGVNCLANAVDRSLAVAVAGGGRFVRANQWVNAYVANEGFVEGRAGAVMRYRRAIGAEHVTVWADVQVKLGAHAITADRSLAEQARDAAWFGADVLIGTGSRLGDVPDAEHLRVIREATELPVVAGSGVRTENLAGIFAHTDGAIVGSSIKTGGVWHGALDGAECERLCAERDALESRL